MMAWTRKLPSGRWQAKYLDAARQERTVGTFARWGDARDAAREEESKIHRGVWTDPELARTRLADYAEGWAATKGNVRARTRINIEGRLRNYIVPAFGDAPLSTIQPRHVRAWVAELSARLAPSTVKATYRTFSQIMATAEIDGFIPRSPCIGVELPAETSHEEMHFLAPPQVGALADSIDDRYSTAIYTAAYTGLRAGELWALRLGRVDLRKRTVSVTESLSEVRGELVMGPTKTRARRSVMLPGFLAELIGEHIERFGVPQGYLFSSPRGGPVRHHNFKVRHFMPAVQRACEDPTLGIPAGLRFHDLRHTCAAILIAAGWNTKQIQERLGHASIRTTLDRYGHLFEGHDEELLQRLDDTVRKAK